MVFTGAFARSIDQKLRIAIPKVLREVAGAANGDSAGSDRKKSLSLFLAPGVDGCLAIFTEEAVAKLALRLENDSPTRQDVRDFSRLFYAQAQRVELDTQGRIRIPPDLAKMASLEREAVLVGVGDRMELWDSGRWKDYLAEKSGRYDQIAEGALSSGATTSSAASSKPVPR